MNFEEFSKKYRDRLEGSLHKGEQIEVSDLELLKMFTSNIVVFEYQRDLLWKKNCVKGKSIDPIGKA